MEEIEKGLAKAKILKQGASMFQGKWFTINDN